jgi:hypothetical protein
MNIFLRIMVTVCLLVLTARAETPKIDTWHKDQANPYYCANHQSGDYKINILNIGMGPEQKIKIEILKDQKVVATIDGHEATVFAIQGSSLYYAIFSIGTGGAVIHCRDLTTGKLRWIRELQGLPPKTHSMYSNLLNLRVTDQGVEIFGHESYGDYIEVLDAQSGKQLSHKIVTPPVDS